jgi:large subunit ribosomal protein L4
MYRAAIRSILSELVRQERLIIVEDLGIDAPKTKELAGKLAAWGADNVNIVTHDLNEGLFLSARNLPNVGICEVDYVDPVGLIRFDKVLMTVDAVKKLEEKLS